LRFFAALALPSWASARPLSSSALWWQKILANLVSRLMGDWYEV
jgi:hypothetical protein